MILHAHDLRFWPAIVRAGRPSPANGRAMRLDRFGIYAARSTLGTGWSETITPRGTSKRAAGSANG